MLIGLVGKPSCGKSTFFKSATLADVLIASYPFATIEPNHGMGYVRVKALCDELGVKCNPRTGFCNGKTRFVPVELMDVAGLVEGASEGKGLGNKFLDDLRQAGCFIHVVDVSGTTNSEGQEGEGNPIEDVRMLENELNKWYVGVLNKVWPKLVRGMQSTKKDFAKTISNQFSGLGVKEDDVNMIVSEKKLDSGKAINWTEEELFSFAEALRHNTKPMIIAANKIDKEGAKEKYEELKKEFPNLNIIPCSADSELALRQAASHELIEYAPGDRDFKINEDKINEEQKNALMKIKENVLDVFDEGTGIQKILDAAVFDLLKYIYYRPNQSLIVVVLIH